jgi:hypothetical protein
MSGTIPAPHDPHDALLAATRRATEAISMPKAAPPDSFVLHAPLELLARVGLAPLVHPTRRTEAVAMIDHLTAEYLAAGDPIEPPRTVDVDDDVDSMNGACARLAAALGAGDVDEVDRLSGALLPRCSPDHLVHRFGEQLVTSLAAAGHAPIGLALLRRVEPTLPSALLRGALHTIALNPHLQISWHLPVTSEGDPASLHAAIAATPHLGEPGSNFIYPLMSQVQDAGVTLRLLGPVLADRYDVRAAANTLARIAAWSMVHDDPHHAPYGWSHALTMPQAVFALAGRGVQPRTALAVAATFTMGLRAGHGSVDLPEAIDDEPGTEATWEELATAAALHEDAHLVKHTLAAWHAAADDPAYEGLYRTAAARLVAWWQS